MSDTETTVLADLATDVRSKNAGPFWVTLEAFMRDDAGYRVVADQRVLNEEIVAALYAVSPHDVRYFRIPALNVVKISFPRRASQASLHDRDIHAGQQHVLLAGLVVPQDPLDSSE